MRFYGFAVAVGVFTLGACAGGEKNPADTTRCRRHEHLGDNNDHKRRELNDGRRHRRCSDCSPGHWHDSHR